MEEQLSDPLFGPETLMNRFFLSEKALQRIIRSATGMTFTEYLQHRRMEKARGMLTETELPIREICLSCGYASLNTFYKAFQRAYGFEERDSVTLGVARAMMEADYLSGRNLGALR